MFFAARTFLQKVGMTLGIMTFASLTNFGNSAGTPFESDLGVRLSGPACAVVFLVALCAFCFYDENAVRRETAAMERPRQKGDGAGADVCAGPVAGAGAELVKASSDQPPSANRVAPDG